MTANTLIGIARRKDAAAGIDPWEFEDTNPGYVWLIKQQDAVITKDLSRDPTVSAKSAGAGSANASKSYFRGERDRSDVIEAAIAGYTNGLTGLGNRTVAAFGSHSP